MKTLITCIFVLSNFLISYANAQENPLMDKVNSEILKLEMMLDISNMQFEVAPIQGKKSFSVNDAPTFIDLKRKVSIDKNKIQHFFDALDVYSKIYYPYNIIILKPHLYDLVKVINKDNSYWNRNYNNIPIFKAISVEYLDGSHKNIETLVLSKSSVEKKYMVTDKDNGKEYSYSKTDNATEIEKIVLNSSFAEKNFVLENPKPIKSIKFTIDFPLENVETKTLSEKNKIIHTEFGDIKLIQMVNNKVVLEYPQTLSKLIKIRGIYKDGRILRDRSASSHTVLSEKQQQFVHQYLEMLKEAKKQIINKTIKTEKLLQQYINKHTPIQAPLKLKIRKSLTFSGELNEIDVLISKEMKIEKFTSTYKIKPLANKNHHLIAIDFNTGKQGILNSKGKWVVKPTFIRLFHKIANIYCGKMTENSDIAYFYLNPKTSKMEKLPYLIPFNTYYNDKKYVQIAGSDISNDKRGLLDITNMKVLLSPTVRDLDVNKYFYVETIKESSNKITNLYRFSDNKKILSFGQNEYSRIELADDRIILKKLIPTAISNAYSTKYYLLDQNGKRLNKMTIKDIESWSMKFHNGYLLVKDKNDKFMFIDKNAKKAPFDVSKYKDVEPFREGYARICKKFNKECGFINTKGKLVIPIKYGWGDRTFYKGYTRVALLNGQNLFLINQKGEKVADFPKFTEYERGRRNTKDDNKTYWFDNRVFNYKGEETTERDSQ
ncbi:WG repeat-containing protein [Pasteurella atlantica]|uniref:WG repeat-containing protein n=1 Tax=Pasteurellaceae TaxID=712 RepID=UPI00275CF43F|nr:WG repeat-containing protein [Pasteurella atlantica]MDP8100045.1 WG repeat-containing protein [Pasteurella atlantica]MDP8107955.1 WG repeat-containing protein [Pasteurella atlantica]MDP8117657.1 WG repeat-containing protein [Pasteurella atlantica]